TIYWLVSAFGWPLWLAALAAVAEMAVVGVLVHVLIISPILGAPPINQFLATGGLLFFLQSLATLLWTTDHRSLKVPLPVLEVGGMFLSAARLIALDRKSTRLNSSHVSISYAVFCLKKKKR